MVSLSHSAVFFPAPPTEYLDKHTKLMEELQPHTRPVPLIAVSRAGGPDIKSLEGLQGSKLLQGTVDQYESVEKTEVTRAFKAGPSTPVTDARAAARGRRRLEVIAMRGADWTRAKSDAISNSLRSKKPSSDVHTMEIVAWEDNLRSEQIGVNYRLMHNAVAVAAGKYGEKYPALRKINAVLAEQRGKPKKVEGMPWLCATEQKFAKFAMPHSGDNPDEFRPEIVRNLLENIHLLDSSIDVNAETKDHLFNVIYRNFNNLYERKIDPTDWSNIPQLPEASENAEIDLPFPSPEMAMMQGALKYLNNKQPGVARILLSERNNIHLRKEVERFGLEKFFHYVTGTPLVSVYTPSDVADAERTEPTEVGTALQEVFKKKDAEVAELVAQKIAEAEASAEGKTPAERKAIAKYIKELRDLKPALARADKDALLQWKQYHHTTVEDLYRVPDDTLLKDALQAFVEAGTKFSPRVALVAVGPNENHVMQTYDLLARGGKITDEVYISRARGIVINPGLKQEVRAARTDAIVRGVRIEIDHVSALRDAKI